MGYDIRINYRSRLAVYQQVLDDALLVFRYEAQA
jgi:hypothetical protein